jgi:hypothetical protein
VALTQEFLTGDGFLAAFGGPARTIRSDDAIRAEVKELGPAVRLWLDR